MGADSLSMNELLEVEGFLDISSDGDSGILKRVDTGGAGATLDSLDEEYPEVQVDFTAWMQSDGACFDHGEAFYFLLGTRAVLPAWDIGISTMRVGEKSRFIVSEEYADDGRKRGTVIFDILLVGWKPSLRKRRSMSAEAKIAAAMETKDEGNAAFKQRLYDSATERYSKALSLLETVDNEAMCRGVSLSCNLNLAACCIETANWQRAIHYADAALRADPRSAKAFYRRAQAFKGMQRLGEAKTEILKALQQQPASRSLRDEFQLIKNALNGAVIKQQETFGSMFDRGQLVVASADPEQRAASNKYVYFDLECQGAPLGRVVMELFTTEVFKTAENFRCLCTGERGSRLLFRGTKFHRRLGGVLLAGNIGMSIYGRSFGVEPSGRKHSEAHLLTTFRSPRQPHNTSAFGVTLGPAPSLDASSTVFGRVVEGNLIIVHAGMIPRRDQRGSLSIDVTIAACGEMPEDYLPPSIRGFARKHAVLLGSLLALLFSLVLYRIIR